MAPWLVPILLLLAIWVSFRLLASRLRRLGEEVDRGRSLEESSLKELRDDLERKIGTLGTLLSMVASGKTVAPDMIRDLRAFGNVDARDAQAMIEKDPATVVVDVRTPDEYAQGHIPGAKLIPLDDLATRYREIPPDVERIVVHCEAGGRSAAACEYLAGKGYQNLLNMVGGMHAWRGSREVGKGEGTARASAGDTGSAAG